MPEEMKTIKVAGNIHKNIRRLAAEKGTVIIEEVERGLERYLKGELKKFPHLKEAIQKEVEEEEKKKGVVMWDEKP